MYQALRLLHQHAWLCTTISKVSNTQKRTTVGSFSSHLSWRGDRTWHKHQKDCSAPPISNSYIRQFNLLELPWSRAFGAPVNRADAKYSRYLHGKNTFFFIKKEDYVNYILLHGSTGHEEKKKKKKKKGITGTKAAQSAKKEECYIQQGVHAHVCSLPFPPPS